MSGDSRTPTSVPTAMATIELRWTQEMTQAHLDLRHEQLRVGMPRGSERYPGVDDDPSTRFLLAFDATTGKLVGCATMQAAACPHHAHDPHAQHTPCRFRIRAMAVAAHHQNRGIGSALVRELQRQATADGSGLWCNARLRAVPMYERCGFRCVTAAYELPNIGPHRDMVWGD
ncbi:MAG: GNAT family N-acetyltransferase [Planctomycetota bacterium]|nr:GNAT family N-acetyltransferase [Planctomycetota bacterium]MDA1106524.1 GNAT family N-acetyltransferase [Planctomycetota bacterium]